MKRVKIYITIALLFTSIISINAQQLTLDECHTKAKQHYPAIAQYNIIEQSKDFDIKNANMAYLPQISLGAQATWQSDITKIDIDIPVPKDIDIPVPDKDQYKVTAEVNQLIWDGGVIGAQKKMATADAELQKHKLETELYTLKERVNNLYFGILLLDERLQLHYLLEKELERNYDRVKSYVANGVANEADLSAVKVEQLKSKQDRVEMESSRKAYIKMLSIFIGEELGDKTKLTKPLANDVNSLVIQRPELQMFDAQQDLINSQKDVLTSKNLPKIGAFAQGGYGKPGLNMFDNKFKTYLVGGVRLSWNFGNLYTYSNDKRKIDLQQAMLETNRETFIHNVSIVIPQQQIEIEKYREQMKDDNEIISLRKLIREAAEAKVENGTMTVSDMLKEMTAEEAAKQAKVLHEIQYLMSIYKLKYTTN
ncbi:MAG: TolC family protein [Proteiniphilum sp.]|nr:TolC family protein [Proteiniphilum sp.]